MNLSFSKCILSDYQKKRINAETPYYFVMIFYPLMIMLLIELLCAHRSPVLYLSGNEIFHQLNFPEK